jgi:hypothetical protein
MLADKNPNNDAENMRIAAGTMNPANPTVPWATWDKKVAGVPQVFVSRLVGTGAEAHFEIANGGAPISTGANSSTRPDITFSGNTPYISWREDVGGGIEKGFFGHLVLSGAVNPAGASVNVSRPAFCRADRGHPRQSDGVQPDDLRYDRKGPCVLLRWGFGDLPSDARADRHRESPGP